MFTRTLLLSLLLVAAPFARAVDVSRAMILLPPSGMSPEDIAIATEQRRVSAPHATIADYERLGWAFVGKARRTLDNGYYKLAETTATVMDATFGPSDEAALLRGHVDHNLHRFHDAEEIARRLVTRRGLPEDWALLSDALMEQGNLREAIDALQHFANLKPGPEADTRIAHLRWLKGDLAGAIAAMSEALRETSPQDRTSAAWMLARLAGFYLQAGHTDRAGELARGALTRLPDYPPALLAAGRAQLARHAWGEAIALLSKAEQLNPLPEYQWCLADARRAAGDEKGAAAIEADLKARGEADDPRTFALFLATRHEATADALRLARAELTTRADVLTHDALAWALLANGDTAAAAAELPAALAEGTRDPRLLLHAAIIAQANGRIDAARRYAAQCRASAAALLPSERTRLGDVSLALERGDGRTRSAAAGTLAAAAIGTECMP